VLPIGGLKEKVLAAHRAGIRTILIPKDNRKDLREIPKRIRESLRMVRVEFVDDVLREALVLENPDEFIKKPGPLPPQPLPPTPSSEPAPAP
jgi:ATP-dependent Lon protease